MREHCKPSPEHCKPSSEHCCSRSTIAGAWSTIAGALWLQKLHCRSIVHHCQSVVAPKCSLSEV
ncbi:hypothetical protein AMTR_s00106p00154710 [Amborella trichopoda]|uniref:Uncharacterized protein n=1 Tax=Amborella trichopoda TaxID=13333 RepID=W1P1F8_AMBTC|nr:hypothetical protein AMTR_s00106p00154710 [Amborella trichopoda]